MKISKETSGGFFYAQINSKNQEKIHHIADGKILPFLINSLLRWRREARYMKISEFVKEKFRIKTYFLSSRGINYRKLKYTVNGELLPEIPGVSGGIKDVWTT
ncbi:MAG: hypothetical protein LIP12_06095 [Clostridiales bacterium]|nr:hypothetical protein [Clostridiales bacterium]